MSAKDLKTWMERNNKNVIDVASRSGLSLNTVKNYLDGKGTHRSTQRVLEMLVREPTEPPKKAVAV